MTTPKKSSIPRRQFIQLSAGAVGLGAINAAGAEEKSRFFRSSPERDFNQEYRGPFLNRIAFPLGGLGAGMVCLEGTGALSHFSLRNRPEVFNEPCIFAAVSFKGRPNAARVLEGPVPGWKLFGAHGTGNGAAGASFGLPRFSQAAFNHRFPFATVSLAQRSMPLTAQITGWSPFEPGASDDSSLPVAALEYHFTNKEKNPLEVVFSFNAKNFMAVQGAEQGVRPAEGGFTLWSAGHKDRSWEEGAFAAVLLDPGVKVNHAWFRGGWWDALTMTWNDVAQAAAFDRPPVQEGGPAPGASLFLPFTLEPKQSKTVRLLLAWHCSKTNLRFGKDPNPPADPSQTHRPWYSSKFANINEVVSFWRSNYDRLKASSEKFSNCFYDSTLPPEIIEAVAANLTILKSPTVLRQADGKLWAWEGCSDNNGCCHGSCTHVWNYAQAIPHLFPALERSLRETEFGPSQNEAGHQTFRSALPIRLVDHDFHAAADGQLGGIMKVFRDWRISGDSDWLRTLWPNIKRSLDYCIDTWDPSHKGWLEEPHHNTYDIEFWGPDGMCTSFYLGALKAAQQMGDALGEPVPLYVELYDKGIRGAESDLFDGEYFIQKIEWKNLKAKDPTEAKSMVGSYSPEARTLLEKEGPKYQYGKGCLADGVLGAWLAAVSGVGQVLDASKVSSHLKAIHKYNLKEDLSDHANPQRPAYACGAEGGLLLCTWPKGGALSLPFVYSDEVWTGIEYQVASHLMLMGFVKEGLDIVRVCRARYDGRIRNPFNEYECGHWYARAMSSYALLQGMTGARYDAVEKILYLAPRLNGDFRSFFSAQGSYGTVGMKRGKPFYEPVVGSLEIKLIKVVPGLS